jgi:hypothetical protein
MKNKNDLLNKFGKIFAPVTDQELNDLATPVNEGHKINNPVLPKTDAEYIKRRNEGQQQPVQGEGFTGGEWKVEYTKEGYNDNIWVVSDCKKAGFVIASLERSASIQGANDEAEANARLIAEAKNMYAALINLVDVWDRGDMHLYPQGKEMLKKAKAIISRIK